MDFYFDGVYAYGTGVCDAKSSVAAILIALSEINSLNFGIALLCDEEEGGKGSLEFAKRYRGKAIVMEPTDFRIAVDHYGGIDVSVNIKGKASHGSYPEYGINAIDKAIEMTKKLNELKLPGKMSFIEIRGGDGQHVIPEECFLRIDFALPPKIKAEEFFTLVEGTLKEYGDFKIEEFYDGYEEDSFDLFEEALKRSDVSADYVEMHSWTDAINLKNAGWNAIVWGPGELYRCHTPLERVKLQEIEKASRVLVNFNEILK
jgi:acetylornithine deacetylase